MSSSRVEVPHPSDVSHAHLELCGGLPPTRVRAAPPSGYRDAAPLAAVSVEGRPAAVHARGSTVRVEFRRSWLEALVSENGSADIELANGVPWSIELRGGVNRLDMDLSALSVVEVEIRGGACRAEIRLPRPIGTMRVVVYGGLSDVTIVRPIGVAAAFRLHGGGTSLSLDELSLGAVGPLDWKSPGFADAHDRVAVEIHGGAAVATLRSEAPFEAQQPAGPPPGDAASSGLADATA